MSNQELFTQVETAIRRIFNLPGKEIFPSTTLVGDLGAESIDFLDLGYEIEQLVHIPVDFREVLQQRRARSKKDVIDLSVQDVIEYLQSMTAEGLAAASVAQPAESKGGV